jgi:hypothetical protein
VLVNNAGYGYVCPVEDTSLADFRAQIQTNLFSVIIMTKACKLAEHWIAAWNAHDLDLIMTHYEDAIELTSPVAAQLLGTPEGKVSGKANLKAYFQRGLAAYPELHFRLDDVLLGVSSVVLFYTNQKGTQTAEFMELSATGKVARVVANYSV